MSLEFKQRLVEDYTKDPIYNYILKVLANDVGAAKLPFIREPDGLIFRLDATTRNYTFAARRLYVLNLYIKDVLEIVYRDGHLGYARCLEKASAWYMRGLAKYIREYIRYYPKCQIY